MMDQFTPFSPVDIKFFSQKEATAYLSELTPGEDKILLLASSRMISASGMEKWLSEMKRSCCFFHFDKIPANPSVSDVFDNLRLLKNKQIDKIIAIGGGSCIDLAKAISALLYLIPADTLSIPVIRSAIKNKEYLKEHAFIDIIALPTTSGTGSEVTKWATIWDMEKKEKLSVDCMQIFPKVAVLVPEFMISMPERLTLSTGLDALCHAIEAFWAKSRTPLSQALAICAIKYIEEYLPKVMQKSHDIYLRQMMCTASLMAGLAFSITRTTACHSISYPLTLYFGIEHGLAASLTLVQVAEYNEAVVPEIRQIYSVFGGKDEFIKWLTTISSSIIDLKLSSFGIKESDLDFIVDKTFTQGRMDNNPVLFTSTELRNILQKSL